MSENQFLEKFMPFLSNGGEWEKWWKEEKRKRGEDDAINKWPKGKYEPQLKSGVQVLQSLASTILEPRPLSNHGHLT